jgi:hypothetical protein
VYTTIYGVSHTWHLCVQIPIIVGVHLMQPNGIFDTQHVYQSPAIYQTRIVHISPSRVCIETKLNQAKLDLHIKTDQKNKNNENQTYRPKNSPRTADLPYMSFVKHVYVASYIQLYDSTRVLSGLRAYRHLHREVFKLSMWLKCVTDGDE